MMLCKMIIWKAAFQETLPTRVFDSLWVRTCKISTEDDGHKQPSETNVTKVDKTPHRGNTVHLEANVHYM